MILTFPASKTKPKVPNGTASSSNHILISKYNRNQTNREQVPMAGTSKQFSSLVDEVASDVMASINQLKRDSPMRDVSKNMAPLFLRSHLYSLIKDKTEADIQIVDFFHFLTFSSLRQIFHKYSHPRHRKKK